MAGRRRSSGYPENDLSPTRVTCGGCILNFEGFSFVLAKGWLASHHLVGYLCFLSLWNCNFSGLDKLSEQKSLVPNVG